jgi:hypothetical protein
MYAALRSSSSNNGAQTLHSRYTTSLLASIYNTDGLLAGVCGPWNEVKLTELTDDPEERSTKVKKSQRKPDLTHFENDFNHCLDNRLNSRFSLQILAAKPY